MVRDRWIECPITDVLLPNGIKIGPFGSQLKKETLIPYGQYKVYGQENVYEKDFSIGDRYLEKEHFDKLSSCEIVPGDFVMSTMGTIVEYELIPLLKEYWFDEPLKVKDWSNNLRSAIK